MMMSPICFNINFNLACSSGRMPAWTILSRSAMASSNSCFFNSTLAASLRKGKSIKDERGHSFENRSLQIFRDRVRWGFVKKAFKAKQPSRIHIHTLITKQEETDNSKRIRSSRFKRTNNWNLIQLPGGILHVMRLVENDDVSIEIDLHLRPDERIDEIIVRAKDNLRLFSQLLRGEEWTSVITTTESKQILEIPPASEAVGS